MVHGQDGSIHNPRLITINQQASFFTNRNQIEHSQVNRQFAVTVYPNRFV